MMRIVNLISIVAAVTMMFAGCTAMVKMQVDYAPDLHDEVGGKLSAEPVGENKVVKCKDFKTAREHVARIRSSGGCSMNLDARHWESNNITRIRNIKVPSGTRELYIIVHSNRFSAAGHGFDDLVVPISENGQVKIRIDAQGNIRLKSCANRRDTP